jgi:Tfp pilus assembly protein PilO
MTQALWLKLKPNERRLALAAGGLIGCWALLGWVVQPLWHRAGELRLRVETQAQKLEAFDRLLAQAPSVDRVYEGFSAYLEPGGEEQARSAFLNELTALSRRSNLELNLKPRPVRRDERTSRFDVELDLQGTQQDLLAFLDELLRLPRLVAIERLRISAIPTRSDLLRANLVIQKLTLH